MKMSFEVTAKKLFGVNYERLIRTLFLEMVVFWGLHISGLQVEIAPFILRCGRCPLCRWSVHLRRCRGGANSFALPYFVFGASRYVLPVWKILLCL